MAKKTQVREFVHVEPIQLGHFETTLTGKTSLIMHKFSEKAQRQIEEKQQREGQVKSNKKPPRDPLRELADCVHYFRAKDADLMYTRLKKMNRGKGAQGGDDITKCFQSIPVGFPACGFKEATRRGVKDSGVTMKDFSGMVYMQGLNGQPDLMEIKFKKAFFRVDHVIIGMGIRDIRYRPEFRNWSTKMLIEFSKNEIRIQDVINAINRGGNNCGVGEWRPGSPQKPGPNGRYMAKNGK